MDNISRQLASFAVFEHFGPRKLARLKRSLSFLTVAKRETIVCAERQQKDVVFVLEGKISAQLFKSNDREVAYYDFGPGAWFGAVSAIAGTDCVVEATAHAPSSLALMPHAYLLDLLDRDSQFARKILFDVCQRTVELSDRLCDVSALPVGARIYRHLLRLSEARRNIDAAGIISDAPTQETIASFTGTHREAVAREMSRLKRDGIVDYQRGRIEIIDKDALQRLANENTD